MAAAGAVLILFSTGRGTPFGTVVPTVKIATNRELAVRKAGWIDFDASPVIAEGMNGIAQKLMAEILEIAKGKKIWNERNGIAEISIFKTGVIL